MKYILCILISCLLIFGVAVFSMADLQAQTEACPIHGDSSYFTGKTKSVDEVMLWEYSCPRGHTFWVRKW